MLTSYHNHSQWSDGRGSLLNMLYAAQRMGLDELGISDHLVLDPHDDIPRWSMHPTALPDYLAALSEGRRDDAPCLRIGLELDWLPGQRDAIAAATDDPRLDYAIGSVHQVLGLHVDSALDHLGQLGPQALQAMYDRYWVLVAEMASSGLFDIAAHLDLPIKLHVRPSAAMQRDDRADGYAAAHRRMGTTRQAAMQPDDRADGYAAAHRRQQAPSVGDSAGVEPALDAIAAAGMTVELNTAGWDMPCRECYPSPRILAACHERGIPVTIGADAHSTQDLLRHFDRAVKLLQQIGYREIMRFEGRRAIPQPLADFAAALDRP